jgi:hypothetical protein
MPIGGIEFHRASTQQWVDAFQRVPTDEDGLRLRGAGHDPSGYLTIMYADIPGNSWNQNRLNLFTQRANDLLTFRQPISGLPDDDPDKTTDPNDYPWLYWDAGDLCSRTVTVSDATYDNQTKVLSFTISRVK